MKPTNIIVQVYSKKDNESIRSASYIRETKKTNVNLSECVGEILRCALDETIELNDDQRSIHAGMVACEFIKNNLPKKERSPINCYSVSVDLESFDFSFDDEYMPEFKLEVRAMKTTEQWQAAMSNI